MKRIVCLLFALLMLALCACKAGEQPSPSPSASSAPTPTPSASAPATPAPSETPQPSEEPSPSPSPSEEPPVELTYSNPLTGLPMEQDTANQKPVAIMLNNIKAAMPQQGNSQADIIYEVLAEGGITRMLGIYHDVSDLGIVGSVRSARLYYWDLALGHDAIFVHAGGSPEFYDTKDARGLSTIDGVNGYYAYATTGLFWRDRERIEGKYYAYEHSLITSGEKLTEILTKRGEFGAHREGFVYPMSYTATATPAGGENCTTVIVPFSNSKSTTFRYDRNTRLYMAEQYSGAMIDGNDGSQIAVSNVIVLKTSCTVVDDAGRMNVDLSSGEGWFACGGKVVSITWKKGAYDQPLRYYTADGKPLVLEQGKSYVCIIPSNRDIILQ